MSISPLRRFSLWLSAGMRSALAWGGDWIWARPGIARWIYPTTAETREEDYRVHNGAMFAGFHEQERMLADRPRMAFYAAAIARMIRPGDRVIDLGTGTGILAALAARHGAAHVYALDHSEILTHAQALAVANRVENVEFVATHSTAFTPAEKVDVILHEQMGDCLFDESMVANVADLRDRVLKPGGRIVPSDFEFYCEPVMVRDSRVVPFIWELEVQGYDYSSLERHRPQNPGYYHLASTDAGLVDHFLGDPAPALTIDLHTVNPEGLPAELVIRRTVIEAGRLDGLAVFFRARVGDDLSLSTNPLDPRRAPHWGFRLLRTDRQVFAVGDEIEIRLSVERWTELSSWRWSCVRQRGASPLADVAV